MPSTSSRSSQSAVTFWLAALLFPPLGLILLWRRPRLGLLAKFAGSLLMVVLAVAHLYFVFGLRMEVDGSAMRPVFYFGDRETHYEELEKERVEQRRLAPEEPKAEATAANEPVPEAPAVVSTTRETETEPGPEPPAPTAYWTDYRGPKRDGHYEECEILTEWPEGGLKELWRHPIGGGYASFVVAQDMAFTIEQRRDEEVVAAYDMEAGREIWTNSWKAQFEEAMGGPGPRATPTWHEGRIYALGAEGELRAIDAGSGETLWRKNILEENGARNLEWAMAGAPLVVDGMVIVQPGGGRGRSVVAYNAATGDTVWTALDDKQAYTSPMVVTLAGQRQIVVVSASRMMGLTVEEGKLLWSYPWVTSYDVNAAQPVVTSDNTIFISAGYGHGAALVKIEASGNGTFEAREMWTSNRMKNKFSSSVFYEGHLYGLDESILASIDAATGKLNWKGGRYGYGQVLLASGHLVITTEKGNVVLVQATPEEHREVSRFEAVSGKTWNTPAIDGGRLLVRNTREMVCYRIGR